MKSECLKPWLRQTENGVTIAIAVQPSAKKTEIVGEHGDCLKVKIAAPPRDGEANEEVVRFFAALLGVKKNAVNLFKGLGSRKKSIEIQGVSLNEVLVKIPLS